MFGAGLRNPVGLGVHPLTVQLFATERANGRGELDVVDAGSNFGWPCLEARPPPAPRSCLGGIRGADVYANLRMAAALVLPHRPQPALTGVAAYTGVAYPAEYYGDVF